MRVPPVWSHTVQICCEIDEIELHAILVIDSLHVLEELETVAGNCKENRYSCESPFDYSARDAPFLLPAVRLAACPTNY